MVEPGSDVKADVPLGTWRGGAPLARDGGGGGAAAAHARSVYTRRVRLRTIVLGSIAPCLLGSCYLAHERCPRGADTPLGLPHAGFVSVEVDQTPFGSRSELSANFYPPTWMEVGRSGVASECHVVGEEGACVAQACTLLAWTPDDAGTIGAALDEAPLVTVGPGHYTSALDAAPVAGQTLHFGATGGADVPAFEGCVDVPSELVAVLPTEVVVGAPLTLHWGPSDADQVWVRMDAGGPAVRCVVPASEGSLTVPGSITSLLTPTDSLDIGIAARNEQLVSAGTYEVHLIADQGQAALVPVRE